MFLSVTVLSILRSRVEVLNVLVLLVSLGHPETYVRLCSAVLVQKDDPSVIVGELLLLSITIVRFNTQRR